MASTVPLPELLAPAGTLSAALAAYSAGADAVYCGVSRFNAREMGANFSLEDLSRLSAKAKAEGRRFYVTLNTLVKESESAAFIETAGEIIALEPDALILQDPGVASFLKRNYPGIELHGSTQMGIHNSAGIRAAGDLGLSRVILERQLTLDELRRIIPESKLEIEVFIHGALCCSLSGRCLFSSWLGGWSGNRGRCKQPCRRRYVQAGGSGSRDGFLFSPRDLGSLELIKEYCKLGVTSFKIEGRLKQPDHIFQVVRAYRTVLDASFDPAALNEARELLSGTFGRQLSRGFSSRKDMQELIDAGSPGVSGRFLGVSGGRKESAGNITLTLEGPLRLGDKLRIQPDSGGEGPAFTVRSIRRDQRSVSSAEAGDTVSVPCTLEVPRTGSVYKIGESRRGLSNDGSGLPLFRRQEYIDLTVRVDRRVLVVEADGRIWTGGGPFEEASSAPASEQKVAEEFRRSRKEGLSAGTVSVEISGNPFIPASALKQLRRDFWNWLASEHKPEPAGVQPRWVEPDTVVGPEVLLPDEQDAVMTGNPANRRHTDFLQVVPLEPGSAWDSRLEYELPPFCSEENIESLGRTVAEALQSGCRQFRVTSMFQFPLLESAVKQGAVTSGDLRLTAAYPLPVVNAETVMLLAERGVRRVQAWMELEKEAMERLRDCSPLPVEVYRYGRPPLLVTRAAVPRSGSIRDERGNSFTVDPPDSSGITSLYPEDVLSLPEIPGTVSCLDYRRATPGESPTVTFNFFGELV